MFGIHLIGLALNHGPSGTFAFLERHLQIQERVVENAVGQLEHA
jgi:hypothetical protein